MPIKNPAEDFLDLIRLLDVSHAQRPLVSPLDKDFPGTTGHRVKVDLAKVENVDPSTGTVGLICLHSTEAPRAQWLSLMHDAKTGHGIHFTPKPGMYGLRIHVGGEDYFWGMVGLTEAFGQNLFLNNREPLPEGGVGIRTSAETKQIWAPNLIRLQVAHLCSIVMKRASKSIDAFFYLLNLASVGGSIKWVTDFTSRTSQFLFSIRNFLTPSKNALGQKPKSDSALAFNVKAGASKAGDTNFLKATLSQATGPGEGSALETDAVKVFRKLVRASLGVVSDYAGIQSDESLKAAYGDVVLASDTTQELVVESIVGAATYVHQATPDSVNGVVDVAPLVDSVENLLTGEVTSLGDRSAAGLSPDTEFFIEANRLAVRRDPTTGARRTMPAFSLIAQALLTLTQFKEPDGSFSLDVLFRLELDTEGNLVLKQKSRSKDSGPLAVSWDTESGIRLATSAGVMDLDAGQAVRVQFDKGALVWGPKNAGMTVTPDGVLELRGKKVRLVPGDVRAPYGSALFQAEENAYEDFWLNEDKVFYTPVRRLIDLEVVGKFYKVTKQHARTLAQLRGGGGQDVEFDVLTRKNEPVPPKTERKVHLVKGPWGFYEEVAPEWQAYEAAVRKLDREIEWYRRTRLLDFEKLRAPERERELAAIEEKYRLAYESTLTPEEKAAQTLTDNGGLIEVSTRGASLRSNSSIRLRSGATLATMESSTPNAEHVSTVAQQRAAALDPKSTSYVGVQEFKQIDTLQASQTS